MKKKPEMVAEPITFRGFIAHFKEIMHRLEHDTLAGMYRTTLDNYYAVCQEVDEAPPGGPDAHAESMLVLHTLALCGLLIEIDRRDIEYPGWIDTYIDRDTLDHDDE